MTSTLLLSTATLLFTLDLIGTFVFALSGAASGVKHKLDAFGVGVLAFVAGNAGGVTRDLLIGAVPPAAINDWRYVAVSLVAGAVTFVWYPNVKRLQPIVLLFDAAGLGAVRRGGHAEGAGRRHQPVRVGAARHADRYRRRRAPRPARQRDPRGAARGFVRAGCARRRRGRRRRAPRALAADGDHDRGSGPVFWHPAHRDSARMEPAGSPAARLLVTRRCRSVSAAADTAIGLCQFQADIPASDDDRVLRQAFQIERFDLGQRTAITSEAPSAVFILRCVLSCRSASGAAGNVTVMRVPEPEPAL